MTNPTMEPLSERLNVQVTPSMKARVVALMTKQGRGAEGDVGRGALTAYLNKEERGGRGPASFPRHSRSARTWSVSSRSSSPP